MSPTPSAAVSRRRDPRSSSTPAPVNIGSAPRVGQHAGTDTGSGTAESSDRVITGALADAHANLGNDFLAHSPVFGADLSVGMGLDPELAPVDSATALIQQHTMGAVALAMAGFESSDLVPGSAPLSVMRQLMRRGSQAEAEGLDTERAAGRIGSRGGTPLPEAVRVRMERAFGHDFSHVRIHTDGGAAQAADDLHAMAFAIGRDIYFGRGAWRPGTPAGDELLAHELTHVVQADEGRLPSAPSGGGMDGSDNMVVELDLVPGDGNTGAGAAEDDGCAAGSSGGAGGLAVIFGLLLLVALRRRWVVG